MPDPTKLDALACSAGQPAKGVTLPPHLGLVLFVLLVAVTVELSTDTPYLPGRWLGPFYHLVPASQTTSTCCAAVLCVLALLPLLAFRARPASANAGHGDGGIGLRLLPVLPMVLVCTWSKASVPRALLVPLTIAFALALAAAAYGALRRWPPLRVAAVAAAVGVAVRAIHFARYPLGVGGDMLPLTRSALDSLLAGHSPYAYHKVPELLPLTYLPLTWLAYLPAHLLHVDLRWTNVAAELAIPAAGLYALAPGTDRQPHAAAAATASVCLLWSFVFLLPSSVYFDRITTAPVAWAALAWTLALVVRASRRDWLGAGLLAATTPLAAVPAAFLLVAWWRQLPWRRVLGRVALAVAVAAAIVVPFYTWSPRGFVDGAILWFNDLDRFPGTKWRAFQTWQRYVGFGGLFWRAGWQRWLAPIQWTVVAGLVGLFFFRGGRRRELPAVVASAFVFFMVFNSVHWPYFYQPAVWSGLLALTARDA